MEERRAHQVRRFFQWPVLIAAVLVIPVILVEESSVGESWKTTAAVANWAIWIVFAAELVALLAVVPNKLRWVAKNPIDVAVVLMTPPFLPPALQALRAFRVLRLLRLLRLTQQVHRMFSPAGVRWAAFVTLVTVLVAGTAFADLENKHTVWEGLYWAVTTVTTVGYGDVSPLTTGGRILAVVVMFVGIGFVAILTGAIAQRFMSSVRKLEAEGEHLEMGEAELLQELREVSERLRRVESILSRRASS